MHSHTWYPLLDCAATGCATRRSRSATRRRLVARRRAQHEGRRRRRRRKPRTRTTPGWSTRQRRSTTHSQPARCYASQRSRSPRTVQSGTTLRTQSSLSTKEGLGAQHVAAVRWLQNTHVSALELVLLATGVRQKGGAGLERRHGQTHTAASPSVSASPRKPCRSCMGQPVGSAQDTHQCTTPVSKAGTVCVHSQLFVAAVPGSS